MLCIVDRTIDVTMFVKIHNLIQNHKGERNKQTVIDFLHRTALGDMIPGEKLHMIAHGSGTTMGSGQDEYNATSLAKALVDRGLRGDIGSIKLSGCLTGSDITSTGSLIPRYCQAVADEIYRLTKSTKPIRLMVTGFTFTAVTDNTGTVRAKDPVLKVQYCQQYSGIIAKYKTGLFTWESMAKAMDISTPEAIKSSAAQIAAVSTMLFDELYRFNPRVLKGKEDSKYRGLPLADL
jgi:hypothetical protein